MAEEVKRRVLVDPVRLDVAMAQAQVKSDEELSRRSNVTRQTINNIRTANSCSLRVLGDLAHALGINPIDLLITPGFPDPKALALAVNLN